MLLSSEVRETSERGMCEKGTTKEKWGMSKQR